MEEEDKNKLELVKKKLPLDYFIIKFAKDSSKDILNIKFFINYISIKILRRKKK